MERVREGIDRGGEGRWRRQQIGRGRGREIPKMGTRLQL
jgi:hypothetical protein